MYWWIDKILRNPESDMQSKNEQLHGRLQHEININNKVDDEKTW